MRDQKSQCSVNLRVVDHVIVIEDEAEFHWGGRHGVDQRGQDGLRRMGLRRVEQGKRTFTNPGLQDFQSGNHVRPETCRIVIPRIQRHPGRRQISLVKPIGDEGCFAETGRGRDER